MAAYVGTFWHLRLLQYVQFGSDRVPIRSSRSPRYDSDEQLTKLLDDYIACTSICGLDDYEIRPENCRLIDFEAVGADGRATPCRLITNNESGDTDYHIGLFGRCRHLQTGAMLATLDDHCVKIPDPTLVSELYEPHGDVDVVYDRVWRDEDGDDEEWQAMPESWKDLANASPCGSKYPPCGPLIFYSMLEFARLVGVATGFEFISSNRP
ncbi:hypothetical protein HDU83_007911 [Entophlyctis luteolus]|nr:hypothetical protein HDU83_007911 [Entophlyctis luteolus]KAJ3377490.1 hypothetical protein HDU84_008581 [Entophlyctis sp. JEL0112]